MPLLLLAYLGFVSLGLPDGMLGVAWPHMAGELDEPIGTVGFILGAATTGYLLSSVAAGFTMARLGVGWLLAASTAATAVALAGFGAAPVLAVVVGAALFLGLGSGAIDSSLNAYAARHFGARHMNWMHACYGAGAMLGPLVMTAAIGAGGGWRAGYGAVAGAQVLLATAFLLTARSWSDHTATAATTRAAVASTPAGGAVATLALPRAWLGAAAFGVYVGIEQGAGLWAYTLLTTARGVPEGLAGIVVSAYWGSLLVGRVIVGVVAGRVGTHRVLAGGATGIVLGAVVVSLPGPGWLAAAGLMLVGLAAAPIFPLLTLTTAERVGDGHADRAIGMQMGASAIGGAGLASGIGVLIDGLGARVLGPCLVLLGVTLAALYVSTRTPRPWGRVT